jgi:hypothetical protein
MIRAMAKLVPTYEMGKKEEGASDPAPQIQPNIFASRPFLTWFTKIG